MITRIFRVKIYPELREEFEPKFSSVSVQAVLTQSGFVSVNIGKPTKWDPDEYVMISQWENEASLVKFVGESWNEAYIPEGMERYVKECWVHHYNDFNSAK
ncbi:MAG: antibiotic biosynthesis monooxygenase [Pseudomonadales bacterium]|nr:antibiotic biosynthesis monooxygenase [Pseudomonadales bacterium]MBL4867810.1 antibiotic biosynthesis monooxygenase [Pseudomonadales bacterium]